LCSSRRKLRAVVWYVGEAVAVQQDSATRGDGMVREQHNPVRVVVHNEGALPA
jgi:hypothetical protein